VGGGGGGGNGGGGSGGDGATGTQAAVATLGGLETGRGRLLLVVLPFTAARWFGSSMNRRSICFGL